MIQSDFDLNALLDPDALMARLQSAWEWARAEALSFEFDLQIVIVILALLVGFATKRWVTAGFARIFRFGPIQRFQPQAIRFIAPVAGPTTAWLLLSLVLFGLQQAGMETFLVRLAANLFGAWALIRLVSSFIADPFWARTAATIAWTLAALNLLGWLEPASGFLDSLGVPLGSGRRLSVLTVARAAIVIAVFYWGASFLSRLFTTRMQHLPSLNPSARILITKAVQIALMAAAGMMALSAMNIDLSALAIFGGAIGLGIGFGLQKIFSNLVSGVILLLDRSIKPGDVITVDETYGRVSTLGMRFASVKTRDGHEHLIPNEELITSRVINWSYSDTAVRVRRPVGIAYGSDVRLAQKLIEEAVPKVARVVAIPKTVCQLHGFGDNSIDLEVRFWIRDPQNGVNNVTSEVLLAIWDTFNENGIQFPFPQRDIHIVGSDTVKVRMVTED
tara:strand:+ start:15241 stop:16581 length:1341 start_codon:yes stop_codon:yes gene_type:complete